MQAKHQVITSIQETIPDDYKSYAPLQFNEITQKLALYLQMQYSPGQIASDIEDPRRTFDQILNTFSGQDLNLASSELHLEESFAQSVFSFLKTYGNRPLELQSLDTIIKAEEDIGANMNGWKNIDQGQELHIFLQATLLLHAAQQNDIGATIKFANLLWHSDDKHIDGLHLHAHAASVGSLDAFCQLPNWISPRHWETAQTAPTKSKEELFELTACLAIAALRTNGDDYCIGMCLEPFTESIYNVEKYGTTFIDTYLHHDSMALLSLIDDFKTHKSSDTLEKIARELQTCMKHQPYASPEFMTQLYNAPPTPAALLNVFNEHTPILEDLAQHGEKYLQGVSVQAMLQSGYTQSSPAD